MVRPRESVADTETRPTMAGAVLAKPLDWTKILIWFIPLNRLVW